MSNCRQFRYALVLILASMLVSVLAGVAGAQSSPRQVTIDVSRRGWNGDPGAIISVEEGEMVELRFKYGDGDMATDNPHIMMIEGLGLETGQLDRAHPEQLLRFRPEKTGTYNLICKLSCEGHSYLQSGRVRVVSAGGAGGAVQAQNSAVTLAAVPPAQTGGKAELRAKVTSEKGEPLEGVMVGFAVKTMFLISEWMELGQARTDAKGEAVLRFQPNRGGDQTVRAVYDGGPRFLGAEKMMNLAVPEMQLVYEQPAGLHIPGMGFWLLWLILGGIWGTYLLVFYNLRQLSLDR